MQRFVEGSRAAATASLQGREVQATILRLGAKRFGPATVDVNAAVRAIDDHPRLERIVDRLLDATGWADLLATA